MQQEEISALQLFYVIMGFEIGNAMIFGVGADAKQDAWLSILISMLCGLVLVWVYTKLSDCYPGDTLVQMIPKIIGKYLSYPLIIVYIVYFTYLASRSCRDFGELVFSTILNQTPMFITIGSFMVVMIYCLRGGVASLGQMGEIVFPVYILVLVVIWLLCFSIEGFNFKNITPVLGEGIKPVLRAAFPAVLTFPFGETVIMTMFLPVLHSNSKVHAKKVGIAVILGGGILLIANSLMIISALGPEIYIREFFPLYVATRLISIADFFERFESLVILMMVAGVFFKVGGWTYGASMAISQLFKLESNDSILIPLGAIITFLSLIIATNFVEHIERGFEPFMLYVHVPLEIVVPILLLCIAYIRKKFQA